MTIVSLTLVTTMFANEGNPTRGAFERAVAANPALGPAYQGLGIAREMLGQDRAALAAFERFIELDPEHPGVGQARRAIERLRR